MIASCCFFFLVILQYAKPQKRERMQRVLCNCFWLHLLDFFQENPDFSRTGMLPFLFSEPRKYFWMWQRMKDHNSNATCQVIFRKIQLLLLLLRKMILRNFLYAVQYFIVQKTCDIRVENFHVFVAALRVFASKFVKFSRWWSFSFQLWETLPYLCIFMDFMVVSVFMVAVVQ